MQFNLQDQKLTIADEVVEDLLTIEMWDYNGSP